MTNLLCLLSRMGYRQGLLRGEFLHRSVAKSSLLQVLLWCKGDPRGGSQGSPAVSFFDIFISVSLCCTKWISRNCWGWKGPLESIWSSPLPRQGHPRAGDTGEFWASCEKGLHNLWAFCSSLCHPQRSFSSYSYGTSCVPLCASFPVAGQHWDVSGPIILRYLCALIRSPLRAFSSLTGTALSVSPHQRCSSHISIFAALNISDLPLKEVEQWTFKACFPKINIQKGYNAAYDIFT